MNTVRGYAYAKLNLTLDLTGTEGGYHTLDSLVTTIDLADRMIVRRRRDGLVRVMMHGFGSEAIPPEKNNAQRAAERFVSAFGTTGADITIYKNIPIGAGLGGSSADAAGALRLLARLYGIGDFAALKGVADEVGSDTGYLLRGGFCRLTGRGEQAEDLGTPPDLHFFLLCPPEGVSTAACYRKADEYPQGQSGYTERTLRALRAGALKEAAACFGNELYPAAKALNGDVERAIGELKALSPLGVSMTGSGSGVFALFETEELCRWAASRYRGKFRALCVRTAEVRERRGSNLYSVEEEED